MNHSIIPIIAILTIGVVVYAIFNSRRLAKMEVQKTLRSLIESGQQLTPELLERLGDDSLNMREKDFRRGILNICFGIGIAIFGLIADGPNPVEMEHSIHPLIGIAAIFVIMGIARLGLWKFAPGKDNE
ncbi:DUF6249 domain-containing protein [Gammaproteobacteria bacterium]|nr:DUF6249 domain-containing protein [Gammaproteobacteria bacterium]